MEYTNTYHSPLGKMKMTSDGTALTGLWFEGQKYIDELVRGQGEERELPVFNETKRWLDIYFQGKSPDFTPMISYHTTSFRQQVWEILIKIPYGETMTYGEIADMLAEERGIFKMSAQAVGGAVGHNVIAIIIPCHRVIGRDGSLTGYAGGIEKKKRLLRLEGA